MMASKPSTVMRFFSSLFSASNTLPCHAKWLMKWAIGAVYFVSGAMIAVPTASPLGIGPAGLARNRSSSCGWVISSICAAS